MAEITHPHEYTADSMSERRRKSNEPVDTPELAAGVPARRRGGLVAAVSAVTEVVIDLANGNFGAAVLARKLRARIQGELVGVDAHRRGLRRRRRCIHCGQQHNQQG